ncbi:small ribosomal subunit protein uS17c [Cryptomeria japonica]|uniref:small ribosomal subunit protein uS17c n=1 Tax=Cryptomeria japonica TaxID=3369 RepID=UPI0025AB77DC|nr:small ribosomal subunit protein uS17c [Cryptomeria japonica]
MAMVGMGMKFPTTCTTRGTSLSIGQDSCSFFKGSTLSLPSFPIIKTRKSVAVAMPVVARKMIQGEVVCATNDKTVRVKVFRLAVHPKYKKRIKVKKHFQAHDPDNTFKVGDKVQLQNCRPISKTKAFLALPLPPRNNARPQPEELSLPLQSQSAYI